MKKMLITGLTGLLLTWTIANSYSQSPNDRIKPGTAHEAFGSSSAETNTVKSPGSVRLNELNTKAVRNFIREYKNVSDERWFKLDNGSFVVYFTMDSIKSRALYDKKGYLIWITRDYREDILPRAIRHLVKSTYYDFTIYLVNEVTANGMTSYYVTMGDKTLKDRTCWKIIKVAGGEMEVMKEYSEKNE
jgi:hypothetical protein